MIQCHTNGQSTEIDAPVSIDAAHDNPTWARAAPIRNFRLYGSDAVAGDETVVQVCHNQSFIYFRFNCLDEHIDARRKAPFPPHHDMVAPGDEVSQDFIRIALDPSHDHLHSYMLFLNIDGINTVWKTACLGGEQRWDISEQKIKCGQERIFSTFEEKGIEYKIEICPDRWIADLAIPMETFEIAPQTTPVAGLGLFRAKSSGRTTYSVWQAGNYYTNNYQLHMVPQELADLYLAPGGIKVEETNFGDLTWGSNDLAVTLRNDDELDRRICLQVKTLYEPGDPFFSNSSTTCLGADSTTVVRLPYAISFRKKWALKITDRQKLIIQIEDTETRKPLYRAEYTVSYINGLIAAERYGQAPVANPSPGETDFLEKKREYILGRIPEFKRLSTSDGALSDFVLRSADGQCRFNLMEPGVMNQIADFLSNLFDNDIDRLLGATMFLHQRSVMTHSAALNGIGILNPLSMLRLGGSACGNRSVLLIDLLQRMRSDQSSDGFEAYYLTLTGHTVATVLMDGRQVMLDADNGLFYYTMDNNRLASLEEMSEDSRIPFRSFHDNTYVADKLTDLSKQNIWEFVANSGVFPKGAPAE